MLNVKKEELRKRYEQLEEECKKEIDASYLDEDKKDEIGSLLYEIDALKKKIAKANEDLKEIKYKFKTN